MKRIVLLLLACFSLQGAIDIRTPVLAKEMVNNHRYQWADKEVFEWGNGQQTREVITLCSMGTCDAKEWCTQPIRFMQWQALKDYYVYVLKYDNQYDALVVTSDQKFQYNDGSLCPPWITTHEIYFWYELQPEKTFHIARLPTKVNGAYTTNRWAEIVSIAHVTQQDNKQHEFFDVSVDNTHTYFVGKSHIWTHNMEFGAQAAMAIGEGGIGGFFANLLNVGLNVAGTQWEWEQNARQHGMPHRTIIDGKLVYLDGDDKVIGVDEAIKLRESGGGGGPKNESDPHNDGNKKDGGEQLRKAIKGNQQQIELHNKKIEDDKAGINLPDNTPPDLREIVKQGQTRHHLKEIDVFKKNIADAEAALIRRGLKP